MEKALLDRRGRPLKDCENPACERLTPPGILYCCPSCDKAHAHKGGDILSHSESCNARWAERSAALGRVDKIQA